MKIECGDGIEHQIFPRILIISADYEEQYVNDILNLNQCTKQCNICSSIRSMISLTRGVKANHPCPTCLVAKENILDLSKPSTLRTSREMRAILDEARSMNAKDKENRLKGVGLQDVQVCWSFIPNYYLTLT